MIELRLQEIESAVYRNAGRFPSFHAAADSIDDSISRGSAFPFHGSASGQGLQIQSIVSVHRNTTNEEQTRTIRKETSVTVEKGEKANMSLERQT